MVEYIIKRKIGETIDGDPVWRYLGTFWSWNEGGAIGDAILAFGGKVKASELTATAVVSDRFRGGELEW